MLACSPSQGLRYPEVTPNALLPPNSRSDDSRPKDDLRISDTVLTPVSNELKAPQNSILLSINGNLFPS